MNMIERKPLAYLAVRKEQGKPTNTFAVGDEEYVRNAYDAWAAGTEPDPEAEVGEQHADPDFTHESALTDALSRAVDFGLSQYHLIQVSRGLPGMIEIIFTDYIVDVGKDDLCEVVADSDTGVIYGLPDDQYFELIDRRARLSQMRAGIAALPKATLMSIVATFDSLVVDIISRMLRLGDDWMRKSERTLAVSRLASATTIDELLEEAIADEMYQFSRGSHDEQAKYIESTFGVGVKKNWKRWPDYIEVFERRNLIAHGEVKFNKRYVSICSSAGHKGSEKLLGEAVGLSAEYLTQACDVLLEFAILLPFSLWRKHARDQERQAFSNLNEAAYKLIENGRHTPAERVLEFALALQKVDLTEDVRQRLIVNRASALRHSGRDKQATALLDSVDWSGSADVVRLCVASVKCEIDEVVRLLPVCKGSGAVDARTFKQWPCFSFVKDNGDVQECFQKTFDEPLKAPKKGDVSQASPVDSDEVAKAELTVH